MTYGTGTSYAAEKSLDSIAGSHDYYCDFVEDVVKDISDMSYAVNSLVTGSQCINENLVKLTDSVKELTEAVKQCKTVWT